MNLVPSARVLRVAAMTVCAMFVPPALPAQNDSAPSLPDTAPGTTSTISAIIQDKTHDALQRGIAENNARGGAAIVLDVRTGDILAMASFSDKTTTAPKRERALSDAYEPGSVFKTFTIATAMQENLVTPDTVFDCGNGTYIVGARVIKDVHPLGSVSVRTLFAQSSNVGAVKIAEMLKPGMFRRQLELFGFGAPVGNTIPGESSGLLRPVTRWSALSMTSLPIGYEMTATALQLAAAMAALGNNGDYMEPRMTRPVNETQSPSSVRNVASPETCRRMLDLLGAVVTEGTGKQAKLDGWSSGGKTGTTKKLDPELKKYSMKNYIASFCGLAPLEEPRISICVWIDEPRKGNYYGGAVASPVFKEIAEAALTELGVARDGTAAFLPAGTE